MRVLIVGAGIGGLTLARALQQRGLAVEIVERAVDRDHAGTGLFLPANGVRALARVGLSEPVRARARVIHRQRVLDYRGRLLFDIGLDEIWGAAHPCLALPRSALHEVLRAAAGTPIRLGTTVEAISECATAVRARLSDGSTGEYDLVVGADGIHSSVRKLVFDDAAPRYVGQVSWRIVIEGGPAITDWTVMLARGRAFLLLPIGEDRLYCYADLSTPGIRDPTRGAVHRLGELFGDFAEPAAGVLRRLSPACASHFAPIEEVTSRPWVKGRVVLIGDAAHATSPNMAQGASMAMEDALALAEALTGGPPLDAALAAYEARRARRVQWVQEQTHRRDRTRSLAPPIRNCVLRLAGKRIFRANSRPLAEDP